MSPDRMAPEIAIVQMKPRKGKYRENLAHAGHIFSELAGGESVPDCIVFPEAALTGYFLEGAVYDMALSRDAFAADLARVWREAAGTRAVDLVCGFYENADGTYYNSAIYLRVRDGEPQIVHVHRKMFLATYGVFDEERFLSRGRRLSVFESFAGPCAILICEDVWHAIVPTIAAIKGARLLIVPSAAPGRGIDGDGELTSITRWRELLRSAAAEHGMYVAYAGLTGFEGGKGMTGTSSAIDPRGTVIVSAPDYGECIVRARIDPRESDLARASMPLIGDLGSVLPDLLLDDELPLPRKA